MTDDNYVNDNQGDDNQALVPENDNWRTQALMTGGLIGALLGVLSAYLYLRTVDVHHEPGEVPEKPAPRDAARLGIALLAIVRSIAEWGKR